MSLMGMRRSMAGKQKRRSGDPERPPAKPIRRRLAFAIYVLAAMGEFLALYLAYVHYRLHRDPGWESACAISDSVNCDAVVLSPYGSVAGVPLPILGAWFYLVIGAVMALELWGRPRLFMRSPAAVVFAASALATVASVILAVVSITSLATLCLLCTGLYGVNIGLLALSWFAIRSSGETARSALSAERESWVRYSFRSAAGVSIAIVVLLVMRAAYSKGTAGGSEVCGAVAAFMQSGSSEPLEVKVYSDFQCPHCKAVHEALATVRRKQGLRIVEAHYPLDMTCNPRLKTSRHPGACLQARAFICADRQGRGDEFGDRLFRDGARERDALLALARSMGIDPRAFDTCLGSDETAAELRRSIDDATANEVRATPTLFVDGRRHVGRLDEADLRCLASASVRPAVRSGP